MTNRFIPLVTAFFISTLSTICLADTTPLSKPLTSNVSVTGQMTTEKFQSLLQQGFKSVIVNRPDQEAGNLTSAAELRTLAEKAKLSLIYQPVVSGQITDHDAEEFAKYYNSLPKPILLVCKSGSRSTVLFNRAKSLGLIDE